MRTAAAHQFQTALRPGGDMKDNSGPRLEEDSISRVICYLLSALSMGLCFYLFIVIQK